MVADSVRVTWRERDRAMLAGKDELPSSLLRQEIQDSWRRCAMTGITPATDEVPFTPDFPNDSRLTRAAGPVVDRLAEQLAGSPVTVLLADNNALIVDRRAGVRGLMAKLDSASVAPGFGYAEESTGTNGIGTALEERRLFSVKGGEHYRESLQNLVCVGKPIVHPIGGRVEGILDITAAVRDANCLMAPLVEAAVREIEQRLYEMASRDERALLEGFLRTSRRGSSAVVTLSGDLVMSNPAASRLLQPADHTLLWNWACLRLGSRDEFVGEVPLSDATKVTAKARRLGEANRTVGIILELRTKADRTTHRTPTRPKGTVPRRPPVGDEAQSLSGRGLASSRLDQELDLVAQDPGPTLITGKHGVGKRYTARRLHARWTEDGQLIECDPIMLRDDDPMTWQRDIVKQAQAGHTILLRHLELMDNQSMTWLVRLLERANEQNWRIVVTGPDLAEGVEARAYSYFQRRLSVIPLNHRIEEFEDIARDILTRPDQGYAPPRLQAVAVQVLSKHTWPGNVRELESVLRSAAARAMSADIGLQHVPAGYRDSASTRTMASLERAELDALLNALEECHGNKSLAAKRLGVARSTLYRKVREYGIDTDRFVSP